MRRRNIEEYKILNFNGSVKERKDLLPSVQSLNFTFKGWFRSAIHILDIFFHILGRKFLNSISILTLSVSHADKSDSKNSLPMYPLYCVVERPQYRLGSLSRSTPAQNFVYHSITISVAQMKTSYQNYFHSNGL